MLTCMISRSLTPQQLTRPCFVEAAGINKLKPAWALSRPPATSSSCKFTKRVNRVKLQVHEDCHVRVDPELKHMGMSIDHSSSDSVESPDKKSSNIPNKSW